MTLLEKFAVHIKAYPFIQKKQQQLLAVSGGVDSVVLCDLLNKAGYDFVIAHCNFQLRGEESERDEQFVRQLAKQYEKELLINRFDTEAYAAENKLSIQVAARELRYNWFREMIDDGKETAERSPCYIITAHHADDNIETVVMNFFRGTGLKGLVGMDTEFKRIFRPLLPFRKQEILNYAKDNNLEYVEDSSNANSYYTRNYFRNELLPAISKVFPAVEENILKNIERLTEVERIYGDAVKRQINSLVEHKGKEYHITILKLQKTKGFRTILWEIVKDKGFAAAQVDEVVKLTDSDNGSYIDSSTHRIIKNRKWLIIMERNSEGTDINHIIIEASNKSVTFPNGKVKLEPDVPISKFSISNDLNIAAFDAAFIQFPLLLRKWKQGDYFYPLGMDKKKKLSKFFIDQKLSKTDKENVWVLEMDKKIIWVVGYRMDNRVKVADRTKTVMKIVYKPAN